MQLKIAKALLPLLVMPLYGFSCIAFRDFQVRPYLADPAQDTVTISVLVNDYLKVLNVTKKWAQHENLVEHPCRYYGKVSGVSAACQVFRDNTYAVTVTFMPSTNSTSVLVTSQTHKIAENAAMKLKNYLGSEFGTASISDFGGGEMPNKAFKGDLGDAARPSAP